MADSMDNYFGDLGSAGVKAIESHSGNPLPECGCCSNQGIMDCYPWLVK